ncbi:MAG: segregation/condensation protein A [Nanoarchaeota archaeon]|nr:segregation/condensation protein A [Nanoarchaeota archaeon]MBU1445192.1 segregation/condensation protein A [Nanoarchaeota archaeon]MBU2406931.1 segregation/condensation protein A [Nanoarchaeota archaeon]MBU2420857.1 segregation/condensation protein A [Nanoarchaeota archaeon]MBU2475328.1 segregation/condensation protein A [Nanoarchaeota archaeon]
MQDQILEMLLKKDEITWQTLLYDLVKTEQMNPWDIDISLLSQKYLETVQKLQEMNFFISGKVILASSILLKIKSNKFLTENIADFDNLLFDTEAEDLEDFQEDKSIRLETQPRLTIKTPQSRKRKVSIQDLVSALEKALEVDKKRKIRVIERERNKVHMELPEKKVDISSLIKTVYGKIKDFFKTKEDLTFTELTNSDKKEDKIYTIVPLLHLANQEKVDLNQKKHFGEIDIKLISKKFINQENQN